MSLWNFSNSCLPWMGTICVFSVWAMITLKHHSWMVHVLIARIWTWACCAHGSLSFSRDRDQPQLLPALVLLPPGTRSRQSALRMSKEMLWGSFRQASPHKQLSFRMGLAVSLISHSRLTRMTSCGLQHLRAGLNPRLDPHPRVRCPSLRLMLSWQLCFPSQLRVLGLSRLLHPALSILSWTTGFWDQRMTYHHACPQFLSSDKCVRNCHLFSARTKYNSSSILTTLGVARGVLWGSPGEGNNCSKLSLAWLCGFQFDRHLPRYNSVFFFYNSMRQECCCHNPSFHWYSSELFSFVLCQISLYTVFLPSYSFFLLDCATTTLTL